MKTQSGDCKCSRDMKYRLLLLLCVAFFARITAFSQVQSCPANINFATGDLSFWGAKTGLLNGGSQTYPAPNPGITNIPEYSISTTGIKVLTASPNIDLYGGFPTVPTINGYAYNYSVLLGSTATSWNLPSSTPQNNVSGFIRAITYTINVPAGSASVPYTMTYAYAMVLENGTHNSNEQPLFKATLSTKDSIISCASPKYYLPTFNNSNSSGSGATLDTATALANGFSNSGIPFLSHAGSAQGQMLYDVWTKGWTEVTFDLSAYRGQQVTLTFEADNCKPGAHFAYAYVALRNTCAGLQISGDSIACANTPLVYSVPSLANGVYSWTVPPGWTIDSGANTNIIKVTPGLNAGSIIAHEINGCADLRDTLDVTSRPPTVPGQVTANTDVCTGTNSTTLNLTGQSGNILGWVYSTNGSNWSGITNTTPSYTAQNLTSTTQFKAIVQNGPNCAIDTSGAAIITVDPRSVAGTLSPANLNFCLGQNTNTLLTLTGNTGSVYNWQVSTDNTNWNSFTPADTDSSYNVNSITTTTYYRTIVKSGVCPADTSAVATINFVNTPFPAATINPASSTICFGATEDLNANITIGTSYTWSPLGTITDYGNGNIPSTPYTTSATVQPGKTTDYVLTIMNAGCPNPLTDTFHVMVAPKIIVNAGRDTSIISGQPIQFNATVNDPNVNIWSWTPPTGLDFPNTNNPVGHLTWELVGDRITYMVTAKNPTGCSGVDSITVRIFRTGADIFVPSAFTPNGDGKNDFARPICVGIKQLNYFRIYNRWGQLVYSTNQMEQGWDGNISGQQQRSDAFVYIAEGIDFNGNTVFRKGTITLIR